MDHYRNDKGVIPDHSNDGLSLFLDEIMERIWMHPAWFRRVYIVYSDVVDANPRSLKDALLDAFKTHLNKARTGTFCGSLGHYVMYATHLSDPRALRVFEGVLHDELNESNDKWKDARLPYLALRAAGILDLVDLDISQALYPPGVSAKGGGPANPHMMEESKIMLPRIRRVSSYARFDIPVLLVGETGTSKDAVARVIHMLSHRRKGPFVAVNCSAFQESLVESELFGHVKGAFTGALAAHPGVIRSAKGGTLFLDEIGKTPRSFQSKLLRVIETKRVRAVGGTGEDAVDVRFIAASQPEALKDLLPDLKYRLRYPDIFVLPTLNERLNDCCNDDQRERLLSYSLTSTLRKMGLADRILRIKLSQEAVAALTAHKYLGNYRELESILSRAVMSAELRGRERISAHDLGSLMTNEDADIGTFEKVHPYKDIRLRDIIEYADNVKTRVVQEKLREVKERGGNLKSVLMAEGLSSEQYVLYWRKLKTITRKGIRQI